MAFSTVLMKNMPKTLLALLVKKESLNLGHFWKIKVIDFGHEICLNSSSSQKAFEHSLQS